MQILEVEVINGPNVWSIKRSKLIQITLDLEDLEFLPTNKIPKFSEVIEQSIPSLYAHHCSEGINGGFFIRVKEGTWMGHVFEHIALELQALAGMNVAYGRTRETSKTGVYHVIYEYEYKEAGVYVAEASLAIINRLIKAEVYNPFKEVNALLEIKKTLDARTKILETRKEQFDIRSEKYNELKYHVGLSFAGEDRIHAKVMADLLTKLGLLVFYDEYEISNLWGKDLYTHLSEVYSKKCMYCIIFISKHYADKLWTKHELKNAQAKAFMENREYILPIRLDHTEILGINSTIGYIDSSTTKPEVIADLVYDKVLNYHYNLDTKVPK